MNVKSIISGSLLALLTSTAMAQTLDPVRIEMFRSILKGNECVLSEAQAGNILPRFNFEREETRAIVGALVAAGEVRLDGNTLNLIDGSCGTGNAVADLLGQPDVQQFIAIMAENQCAMTEAEGETIFTARGMSKSQVGAVIGPMIQEGIAQFDAAAGVLSVNADYCSPPVVVADIAEEIFEELEDLTFETPAVAAELDRSGMFGMSRVRGLVDVMVENGCMLNMVTPDNYLIAANIDHSFATFMAQKMITDGFAGMVDAENMHLSAPYCVPTGGAAPEVMVETMPEESPAEVDLARVEMMRQIFAEHGCQLNESQMDALLPPAGFTKSNVGPIFDYLQTNGELEDGDNFIRLTGDYCPTAPVAQVANATAELDRSGMFGMSRVRGLVDAMAENGCTLNMDVADGYLAEAGIEHSFAKFMAQKMITDGFASMVDGQNMVLPAPYCIAAGGAESPEIVATVSVPVVEGLSPEAMKVVAVFNAVGCAIPVTSASGVFETADMSQQESMTGLAPFIGNGQVSVNDQNEFVMSAALCDPSKAVVENPNVTTPETPAVETPTVETPTVEVPVAAPTLVENDGTPEGIIAYLAAQNGCSLDASDVEARLVDAGLRMDQAYLVVDAMIADGRATLSSDGGVIALDPAMCVGEAATQQAQPVEQVETVEPAQPTEDAVVEQVTESATDIRSAVLAMLAANNCQVAQSNVGELVAAAGLDFSASIQVLTGMMTSGEATSPDGGQTLVVGAPLCEVTAAASSTPRDVFINLIKQNNCSITAAEFSAMLPVDGLDASTAFSMIGELEAEGVISLPPTRDVVTLSAEMCR